MSEKTSAEVRCLNCHRWFRSGVGFGSHEIFKNSTLYENLQGCPWCRKMTPCNKENMRFVENMGEGNKTYLQGGAMI